MKTFPMFLKTTDRRIVILGGGEQAAQKARLALKTDAQIVLAAPQIDIELQGLVSDGRARHELGQVTPDLVEAAALVFVATGCPGADAALAALLRGHGAPVNVVDRPDLCDAFTPSIVDRDPVVVAIGTEGTAPVLGRRIKTEIERLLEPRLGRLAALAGRLRDAVAARVVKERRRAFWAWVFTGAPRQLHAAGRERSAAELIKAAIAEGAAPGDRATGLVSLVGAGPGGRDLLTLRAVERLQEADVIYYDRLVDPEVLELARRDAERVLVGKAPGAHSWPQERINGVIAARAREGCRVVWLKCGDPGIFGRAGEEIASLEHAGIPWEIVPGVTAASSAAAVIGEALTERGRTDTLVLSTVQCQDGAPDPDLAARLKPGTTLAIYLGAGRAAEIANRLIAAGQDPELPVRIVHAAGRTTEQVWHLDLRTLGRGELTIPNPAVILIRAPSEPASGRAQIVLAD
ncbi:MAG: siroheme synthase CysG [Pikeienuella sp.]